MWDQLLVCICAPQGTLWGCSGCKMSGLAQLLPAAKITWSQALRCIYAPTLGQRGGMLRGCSGCKGSCPDGGSPCPWPRSCAAGSLCRLSRGSSKSWPPSEGDLATPASSKLAGRPALSNMRMIFLGWILEPVLRACRHERLPRSVMLSVVRCTWTQQCLVVSPAFNLCFHWL